MMHWLVEDLLEDGGVLLFNYQRNANKMWSVIKWRGLLLEVTEIFKSDWERSVQVNGIDLETAEFKAREKAMLGWKPATPMTVHKNMLYMRPNGFDDADIEALLMQTVAATQMKVKQGVVQCIKCSRRATQVLICTITCYECPTPHTLINTIAVCDQCTELTPDDIAKIKTLAHEARYKFNACQPLKKPSK